MTNEATVARLPGPEHVEAAPQPIPGRGVRTAQSAFVNYEGASAAEQVFGLFNSYAPLAYQLPFEILSYIELLARYNPDYSQAVENIKTLANSGHELFVDHSSKRKGEKLKERLEERARTIQVSHGGIDGLITKMLDQAATFGAMAGEWVLNEDLTDVVDFIDVNPKSIRFFWEDGHWAPYQKVAPAQAEEARRNGQVTRGDAVKLNEFTFQYFAFDAASGSPYGTPPFVASLVNIGIQGDMIANMGKIVKKLGLLGIVDVSIEPLKPNRNETPEQFAVRASNFLDSYAEGIQKAMSEGGFAHFSDSELKATSLTGNAAGATAIFKQNEELIFSGLKSMPSVQGRSYSTTETYAGVAYDIIIRNTYKFQRACKRLIENGYWLMATVWGETPKSIRLDFHSNKSLHRLQDAQAELLEIKIALMLWATGVIDQNGFAQRLGYSSVKTEYEEPPESDLLGNAASPGGGNANQQTGDGDIQPTSSDG